MSLCDLSNFKKYEYVTVRRSAEGDSSLFFHNSWEELFGFVYQESTKTKSVVTLRTSALIHDEEELSRYFDQASNTRAFSFLMNERTGAYNLIVSSANIRTPRLKEHNLRKLMMGVDSCGFALGFEKGAVRVEPYLHIFVIIKSYNRIKKELPKDMAEQYVSENLKYLKYHLESVGLDWAKFCSYANIN